MQNIDEIEELVRIISKLPGLGPKSARRIILKLINNKEKIHKPLINSLADVFKIFKDVMNVVYYHQINPLQ